MASTEAATARFRQFSNSFAPGAVTSAARIASLRQA